MRNPLPSGSSVLCGIALVLGFMAFLWRLPGEEVALDRNADGIVVLTGGTSRITDALELLAAGRGKRLLITGVNPGTTERAILRSKSPNYGHILACCVDLDYSAINTLGNAVEARRWAIDRGFHSLIIATSAYHMPRALAEIAHQLPDVALIPSPVARTGRARPVVAERGDHAAGDFGIFQIPFRASAHALRLGGGGRRQQPRFRHAPLPPSALNRASFVFIVRSPRPVVLFNALFYVNAIARMIVALPTLRCRACSCSASFAVSAQQSLVAAGRLRAHGRMARTREDPKGSVHHRL